MADAQASGACGRKIVWVQVPSPAFFFVLNMVNNIPQHLISKILRDFYYIAVREVSVTLLLFTSDLINIHISDCLYKHCLCTAVIILTDILQCQVNIIIHQINAVIVDHISVRIVIPCAPSPAYIQVSGIPIRQTSTHCP